MQLKKLWNYKTGNYKNYRKNKENIKVDSSDEEVLSDSCFSLLNHHQEQIKRKRKRIWVQEILKKRIEQGVYHNLLKEINTENRISAIQNMTWSLIVHKNTIKNYSTAPQAFSFWSFLGVLYFLFHKGKDTCAIPQPSVQNLVYVFPIFFRFHKCFNNFHLTIHTEKNLPPRPLGTRVMKVGCFWRFSYVYTIN